MTALITPCLSLVLGAATGFFYRDELFFPTNIRIKVAVMEYHLLTRQKVDMDLVDIIDPSNSQQLASKSKRIVEEYEDKINREYEMS